jgi:hypothetical protein
LVGEELAVTVAIPAIKVSMFVKRVESIFRSHGSEKNITRNIPTIFRARWIGVYLVGPGSISVTLSKKKRK